MTASGASGSLRHPRLQFIEQNWICGRQIGFAAVFVAGAVFFAVDFFAIA